MTKDIKPLIAIYTILILSCWNMAISYKATKQLTELKQEVLQVKKIAIDINTETNGKLSIVLTIMSLVIFGLIGTIIGVIA